MALKTIKTEHAGPKRGQGYLTKEEAKSGSRKRRRVNWKRELKNSEDQIHIALNQ